MEESSKSLEECENRLREFEEFVWEGSKSYVKVKDEKGNIVKKEVVTGFSDGINVEIKEGLQEGNTVLIESKVNEG